MKPYASAPNDVWSLGVILVNLCCGRNPWKRASPEDPTFLAYLKDPGFLKTILPLSPELNAILRRVFECDPHKRISIPELRHLILECPRFTVQLSPPAPAPAPLCTAPPTPAPQQQPCQDYQYPKEPYDYAVGYETTHAYPPSPPAEPIDEDYPSSLGTSEPSLSDGSSISSSSSSLSSECAVCSSTSSQPTSTSTTAQLGQGNVASQILPNFWGSFIPFTDGGDKTIRQQQQQQHHPLEPSIAVC